MCPQMMRCRWQRLVLLTVVAVAAERHTTHSRTPRFGYTTDQKKPYAFEYEVDAPRHGTWHDRQEQSSGLQTKGQFRVALPDNRLQTVTYQATDGQGFQADVHFQQHPDFPSLRGNIGKAPAIGQPVVPVVRAGAPASGIVYPGVAKLRTPKFDSKPSVGNAHSKGPKSSSKAAYPAQDRGYRVPRRRPVEKGNLPPNHSAIARFSSYSAMPSKPPPKFASAEKPKTNHFTIPGTSAPRTNFASAGHAPRPVSSKSLASRPRGRPDDRNAGRKVLKAKPVRGRPSRVRPPNAQPSFLDSALLGEGVPVPHMPSSKPPKEEIELPATKNDSFNLANKERGRYKIRKEAMESVRLRLNSIIHS